jgi:hypothetical protein
MGIFISFRCLYYYDFDLIIWSAMYCEIKNQRHKSEMWVYSA